jgi:hypothetical protein
MATMLKITDAMREAARKLSRDREVKLDGSDRALLRAVAEGKRKLIDGWWWSNVHKVVGRVKLDKLQAMADPARNPMEHERAVASRKLAGFKARRPPGLMPEPPPLPETLDEWDRDRWRRNPSRKGGGVNTNTKPKPTPTLVNTMPKPKPKPKPVNTKPKPSSDRNRDRHSPGYMRDYMRRRRAKQRRDV